MDRHSYKAAAEGKIEFFKNFTDHSLDLLLTPNKNTVLHIYITNLNLGLESRSELSTTLNVRSESSTTNFVKEIFKMCPSLSRQANAKGDTPLHIAARYGHDDIAEVVIKYCAQTLHQDLENGIEPIKEMLRMTNKEKDTALHEAVRYNHLKVVELLIREDPYFSYSANDAGETPLYLAVKIGFQPVVFEILDKCKSPKHGGPLGRTTLHAAVIQDQYAQGTARKILAKSEGISREADNNGWTPLHLAAYFNNSCITNLLLDHDRQAAYMKDSKGRTALHIAAHEGNYNTMKSIVSRCPDCCELVDNRGWNVLHFVMKHSLSEEIIEIFQENLSVGNLLNEKNADGDTPFHYYSKSMKSTNKFVGHPQVDKMAFIKQNLTAYNIPSTNAELSKEKMFEAMEALGYPPPLRVITCEEDDTTKLEDKTGDMEEENKYRKIMMGKAAEAHLVVAALITTVTFAACITMPGGFVGGESSHPGSALLKRNAAFKAFVIMDTISMVFSSSAVFMHLLTPMIEDQSYRENLITVAFLFILAAMVGMGLAFVIGTYAVLEPSLDLAIANCIIGLTFFAVVFLVFQRLRD